MTLSQNVRSATTVVMPENRDSGSNIVCEVWPNGGLTVGIERRFCSRFDLDGLANIAFDWRRGRIPDQQALAVGIILVHGDPELPRGQAGSLASLINEAAKRLTELHADVVLARELDLVEPGAFRFLRLSASDWTMVAACPRSSLKTVMSISSEKREINPKALDSDVPPLNRSRGPSGGSP